MPTEDVAYQQRLKIRRTTLGFGVIQVVLGLALTGLSFTAFVLSESEKIRNACPYWAGFTVFCSGGVGIVAWRYTTVLSMGLFTFFSAVCVVLHMIGTILTGEIGGLLKSIIMCENSILTRSCMCCDSIMTCKQDVPTFEFKGVDDCGIITGLMKELMYGLCVLNIFGSLVCFIATILGCTSVARQAGRDQPLFRRRLSARSDSHEQSQYSWLHYPADANVLPPYAPPIYRSVDNVQDCGSTPYIVPPPVFDPTDLPPPYSSRNASLSSSGISLDVQDPAPPGGRPHDRDDGPGGSSAIVLSEGGTIIHHHYHFQQRVYSENRARPGNPSQITNVVLTRSGIIEHCGSGSRQSIQSVNTSRVSLQSEKAEECKESTESINNGDKNYKSKRNTGMRCLSSVEHSSELIKFEEDQNKRNTKKDIKKTTHRKPSHCKLTEDEFSSTSDSGIGEELSVTNTNTEIIDDDTQELERLEVNACDKDIKEDLGFGVSDPNTKQQDCDLNHLTFSTRDAVSLGYATVADSEKASHGTIEGPVGSGPVDQGTSKACQLDGGCFDLIENLVEEFPNLLPVNPKQDQTSENELIGMPEIIENRNGEVVDNDNIVKENEGHVCEDLKVLHQFSDYKIHEEHITEEVIRLMDDFDARSDFNRTCSVDSALRPRYSQNRIVEHSTTVTEDKVCNGKKRRLIPEPSTSSHANEDPVHPIEVSGTCSRQGRDLLEKSLARSDTCIAVLPKLPRETRTGSDPGVRGVGSLLYPGHHFPFQIIPPNVELPLEIREENMCRILSTQEGKRRKRRGEREVSRSKRRANKEELMRLKCQHRSNRKDETGRLRERHLKTQNSRLRVNITKDWQTYKGKSSTHRGEDDWLRNPVAFPSLKKGNSSQCHKTSNKQGGAGAASACSTSTGKETIV